MPQGIGYVLFEFLYIHLGEVHVFLTIVGAEALDLLPVAAAVEKPAATGDKGQHGQEDVP